MLSKFSLKFNKVFDHSHQIKKRFRNNYLIQNLIKYPLLIEVYIAAWITANQSSHKCKPQAMPLLSLNYIAYCFIA
jgi:hypothetical protein